MNNYLLERINNLEKKIDNNLYVKDGFNKKLKKGVFYGYMAAYVNSDLPKSDFVFYFPGKMIKKRDIVTPSSLGIKNTTPIFTIGGGTTLWGNNQKPIGSSTIREDKSSPPMKITITDVANYNDCLKLVHHIKRAGWKGICLDWEMVDRSHNHNDLTKLLKEIQSQGLICILHSAPQGPYFVDQPDNNNIVKCTGLSKYIDYYLVLLFNKDPLLKNYTDDDLDNITRFWNNPNKKTGLKYKSWGNGTKGSTWDYIEKNKLLALVSCFQNGYEQGSIPPTSCKNNNISSLEKKITDLGWSGIITWAYKIKNQS